MHATLNEEQTAKMIRLKQYFPYRIVWAFSDPATGKLETFASFDKRQMNKALRQGFAAACVMGAENGGNMGDI